MRDLEVRIEGEALSGENGKCAAVEIEEDFMQSCLRAGGHWKWRMQSKQERKHVRGGDSYQEVGGLMF